MELRSEMVVSPETKNKLEVAVYNENRWKYSNYAFYKLEWRLVELYLTEKYAEDYWMLINEMI